MDRSAKLTTEVMTRFLQSQLPELAEKIVAAVNSAPDGNWIAASEEPVRDAGHEFMRAAFEAALQQKVTAAEAAFPPSTGFNGKEKEEQRTAADDLLDDQWTDSTEVAVVAFDA